MKNRIPNDRPPIVGQDNPVRSPLTVSKNHQIRIDHPNNFNVDRVVEIGQMEADKLLEQAEKLVKNAACEIEIVNDIQIAEQADGSRSAVIKRTLRLQKDPT